MDKTESLHAALERHEIELSSGQVEQLRAYSEALWEWNSKVNLTRHTTNDLFVGRDLIDTQRLAELLGETEKVLDVGSGGGVPGIPLAIIRPDLKLTICESVEKKARILNDMVTQLGLPITVIAGRAEKSLSGRHYDTLVARAVGPLWKMLKWFESSWDSIGRLLAIKGPRWVEERGEARHRGYLRSLELRRVTSYPLYGTESESVILELRPRR